MTVRRFHVESRWSDIAVHNGTVYLAGQVADDTTQGIEGQAQEVLGHVDRLLTEAGSDKSLILSCQIYLSDMANFEGMNRVWDAWVAGIPGNAPPRATVQARLARPELLIEIVVVAAQRGG
ncbi:MAG: RidA family protein [Burkholderiales bacterium]|nr:RidA family protein [Burkholderiales bacterium]MDE2287585.1 RidA family protein [Burkholderiales bacterium]MDE2609174.1 RidA family protein [Burkholderiales bacterium]